MNPDSRTQAARPEDLRPPTETLVELIEDAVIVAGRDGKIAGWNTGAARIFGWPPGEAIGMAIAELQPKGATRGPASALQQAFSNKSHWHGEVPFIRKSGDAGLCEAVVIPMADNRGMLSLRDVTARRQKLKRVVEERLLLRTLMDGIPDIIVLKDNAGRYIMRNQAHRILSGRRDPEVLGLTSAEAGLSPDLGSSNFGDDMALLRSGKAIVNREEQHQYSDGRKRWFLTSKFPLRDIAGHVAGIIEVARDITELKDAADELAETRQRLSQHLDNSLLLVAEMDPDFRITKWAGRAEKMFGWTAAEASGRTLQELKITHPDDAQRVSELFARLVEGKEDHNVSRNRNLTKDGSVIHCRWWNSALRDSEGKVRSFLTLAEDITYTVQTLEKLEASDRLLTTLIEATNTGYVLLDSHGRIVATNEKYVSFFGFAKPEAMVGHSYLDFVAPGFREVAARELARLVAKGTTRDLELALSGGDGRTSFFEFNANVEDTKDGLQIHGFFRDISERRRAIEERRAIEAKLQEAQKLESLGVLAGGIAHDFNNLLTGVLGNASLIGAEIPDDSPARAFLEQIEKSAARAADLCKQLLAYSGKGRFDVKAVGINDLIQETTNLLKLSISKRATLDFRLAPSLPQVLADATQIRQIVMNLVINASEAISGHDGVISIATGTRRLDAAALAAARAAPEAKDGEYVWFEIADTGCGMAPEVLARIFDPFFTTKFTGRGLGLAAVLGIVYGHCGALTVGSEPKQGTVFRIFLPASPATAESASARTPAAGNWRGTGSALVVDDEETVRNIASRLLQHLGFKVSVAVNGREALKIFPTLTDLRFVFLDLTMPHMDGPETFRELRRLNPDTRFLIMSGFSEQDVATRFANEPFVDFIEKPFNLTQVRDKLRRLLE
jgi:PAS domain S-box-containing protein